MLANHLNAQTGKNGGLNIMDIEAYIQRFFTYENIYFLKTLILSFEANH